MAFLLKPPLCSKLLPLHPEALKGLCSATARNSVPTNVLTSEIEALNEYITSLECEIQDMKLRHSIGTEEQSRMKNETAQMEFELEAANSLFDGLKEDSARWTRELRKLDYEAENVYGDCLLGAAFLNYTSVFDHELRSKLIYADWKLFIASKLIKTTQNYTIESHMSKNDRINRWLAEGLPRDNHAVQNAILMKWSSRYPVCIDPDQQMLKWIFNHERDQSIHRISTSDPLFDEKMIAAITKGTPVVVHEFEFLNCVLEAIFAKTFDGNIKNRDIIIHGKPIHCHPDFRIYVVISSFQHSLDPSFFANATIIDCSMQEEAIEDIFVQISMRSYDAALEDERCLLIHQRCNLMHDMERLNGDILYQISTYNRNIFDDFPCIQIFKEIKSEADNLLTQMNQEAYRIDEIDVLRREYKPLAHRSAVMFQAFSRMRNVTPSNATSLQTFMQVVEKVLRQLNWGTPAQKLETLTRTLYDYQSKGLKNKDKFLYAFYLAATLEMNEKRLTMKQLQYFLKCHENPVTCDSPYAWITNQQWNDLVDLTQVFPSPFEFLLEDLKNNEVAWRKWATGTREEACLPTSGGLHLDSIFQQLLLLKILRFDALHGTIMNYVEHVLGKPFLTPSIVRLEDVVQLTTPTTPVLIRVGPGTDPLPSLLSLSEVLQGTGKCDQVSMGSGFDEIVIGKMIDAMTKGKWLIVENCHLVPLLMFRLYNRFYDQDPKHDCFRLWLTTDSDSNIQLQFELISHKVTIEAPSSLKLNLLDTYHSLDSDLLKSCIHPAFQATVFSLAFFHAVIKDFYFTMPRAHISGMALKGGSYLTPSYFVHSDRDNTRERMNFGIYGWNMIYEFTKSDLLVSITIIKQYLNKIFYKEKCKIPWSSLRYFIGEVVYGGRITNTYDRRILNTYIEEYFGDFILESTSPFKYNRGGETCQYPMPPVGEIEDYIDHINNLPLLTEPSVFGINKNRRRVEDVEIVRDLCQMLDQSSSNGDIVDSSYIENQQVQVLNVVAKILSKTPEKFQPEKQQASLGNNPKPTTMCLIRELNTFNSLIDLMVRTLEDVRKVSRGEPWILWLSGLTYPEAFMTATLQVACREEGWQIDSVSLNSHVTDYEKRCEIPSKPKTGVYVEGLYLDGANWDAVSRGLSTSSQESELNPLPIIGLFPTLTTRLSSQGCIHLPMYTTKRKIGKHDDKVIAELGIPTQKHESYWILENVCIVMNTD